jgi:hypothetical protein
MNTLYIKAYVQDIYDTPNSRIAGLVYFSANMYYQQPALAPFAIHYGPLDVGASPYPIFPTWQDAIEYFKASKGAELLTQINTQIGSAYYDTIDVETVDIPVALKFAALATVASTGLYSDLTGKPSLATVATSGSYNDLSNKPTIPSATRTFTNPTRSLNTAFQISTTQDAEVEYSVDVSCTMSLTSGQSGTVVLEYADNVGMSTNVKTVSRVTNSNSGALTIGLALTQIGGAPISGVIPAGKYARIRTVNNTGTPTFTLQNAQEVLL